MTSSIMVAIVSAIASLFSLSVGVSDLRVTLGVVVLIVALHLNKDLKIMSTATLTGVLVFLLRVLVNVISTQTIDLAVIFSFALEILFYAGYAFFYKFLVLNEKTGKETSLIILLMLCDFGANSVEYIVRFFTLEASLLQNDFVSIFLAAFIRSALIWLLLKFTFHNLEMRTQV